MWLTFLKWAGWLIRYGAFRIIKVSNLLLLAIAPKVSLGGVLNVNKRSLVTCRSREQSWEILEKCLIKLSQLSGIRSDHRVKYDV